MLAYRCLLTLWMLVRRVRVGIAGLILALFSVACGPEPMRAQTANDCDEAQYVGGVPGYPLRLSSSKRLLSDKGVLASSDEVPWYADSQQRTEARVQKYRTDNPAPQCSAGADRRVVLAIPDDLYARWVEAVEQAYKGAENERPETRYLGQQSGSSPIRLMPPTTTGVDVLEQLFVETVRTGRPVMTPATPEPDPALRARDHPAAQAVGGAVAGVIISLVPGGSIAVDAGMASGRVPRGTPEARAGKAVGEFVGGFGQIVVGCAGMLGGGGLATTGVGSPGGVVIFVGSAGLVANGLAACAVSFQHGGEAIAELLARADDSQPPAVSSPPPAAGASPPPAGPPPPPPKAAAPPPAAKPPPSMAARPGQTTTTTWNKGSAGQTTTTHIKPAPAGQPTIRNAHLAGKVHPKTKVPFDKDGYPDFRAAGVVKKEVKIKFSGNRNKDYGEANKQANIKETPEGYTWHHHQDGTTMQLVPKNIHRDTGHTGGFAGSR